MPAGVILDLFDIFKTRSLKPIDLDRSKFKVPIKLEKCLFFGGLAFSGCTRLFKFIQGLNFQLLILNKKHFWIINIQLDILQYSKRSFCGHDIQLHLWPCFSLRYGRVVSQERTLISDQWETLVNIRYFNLKLFNYFNIYIY